VVENPPLRRGSPIHDAAWSSLARLHTEKTRLALWFPYPQLAVAELSPPAPQAATWDFSAIDPIVEDFVSATGDRNSVFSFATIPSWMFAGPGPGEITSSPGDAMWNYETGSELRDPSGRQVAEYFARVAAWYTAGGFTDELGRRHVSGHFFRIPYWEVLNEPEYEHGLPIETYTRLYDSITAAVHNVSPATKFVGMSLAEPAHGLAAFEYFLNPAHHRAGTPLDAISYHFYATGKPGESDEMQQQSFFAQADAFLRTVQSIELIRKRLSPHTETQINEAGCIASYDIAPGPHHMEAAPDTAYWSLCGAVFAYLYGNLAEQGINVLGASQLLGYPSQYPSVSLLDWKTGEPNARYRVLQLLHSRLGPGDRPARIELALKNVYAAAFRCQGGRRRLLLVNKTSSPVRVLLARSAGSREEHVDLTTAERPPVAQDLTENAIQLGPFAVSITTMPE
jgi:hypothetical protein